MRLFLWNETIFYANMHNNFFLPEPTSTTRCQWFWFFFLFHFKNADEEAPCFLFFTFRHC